MLIRPSSLCVCHLPPEVLAHTQVRDPCGSAAACCRLDTSQKATALHSQTTTSRPVLTAAILLTYLLLLIGRLFQRCHLSRIDEVLWCGDSVVKLHTLSQIPPSCLHRQHSVLATVPRILPNFFPVSYEDSGLHGYD